MSKQLRTVHHFTILMLCLSCFVVFSGCAKVRYVAYQFQSEPSGAHVSQKEGGRYFGTTPTKLRVIRTNINKHKGYVKGTFIIEKKGFKPEERVFVSYFRYRTAEVARTNPNILHVLLNPVAPVSPPILSKVEITSDPATASVYVDGDFKGKTPLSINLTWTSNSSKKEIRVEREGYPTETRSLHSSDKRIHVVLQPSRPKDR